MIKPLVVGAGSWGTTFAQVIADADHDVLIWSRDANIVNEINQSHTNNSYHPNVKLPKRIVGVSDVESHLGKVSHVFLTIPAQSLRVALRKWKPFFNPDVQFVSLIKGLELTTSSRMSELIKDELSIADPQITVISGPNLATEIIQRQPTATTVACTDIKNAEDISHYFASEYFRPFWGSDVIGTEIAGVTKNVIAIANGIAVGLGLGENTQSSVITRGLAEMTRLGVAMGAQIETFLGLAGIGDLIATSQSPLSRNRTFGQLIGEGYSLADAAQKVKRTVEGSKSAAPLVDIARKANVEMPISEQIAKVVRGEVAPDTAISTLLAQALTKEH
jgi:glycerol-3-phosphate dehydrogenase (NAD(P)+)